MLKHHLQAIFFDFDGVIADTTLVKTEGFRILFHDYPPHTIEKVVDHHLRHGGISRIEKIRHVHTHILGQPLTEEELSQWAARYAELVKEKVIEAKWIAGARQLLEEMTGKTKLFLISGTPEEELRYITVQRGIAGLFTEILGSPVRKSEHIRRLLKEYRLNSASCAFVGDALTDYDAAAETQLHFIGIKGDADFPQGTTVLADCRRLKEALALSFSW